MESYREMFERCTEEREKKFEQLRSKVKKSVDIEKGSLKKTKLAYVGLNAKPPPNVVRAQARHGTAGAVGAPMVSRPRPVNIPSSSSSSSSRNNKPRMAPMMAKTMKMVRGMKSGFRR